MLSLIWLTYTLPLLVDSLVLQLDCLVWWTQEDQPSRISFCLLLIPQALGGGCGGDGHGIYDCGPDNSWGWTESGLVCTGDLTHCVGWGNLLVLSLCLYRIPSGARRICSLFPLICRLMLLSSWMSPFVPAGSITLTRTPRPCLNSSTSTSSLVWFCHSSFHLLVGRNYQLQVNVPPNKDGLIDDKDVKVLEEFGQYECSPPSYGS